MTEKKALLNLSQWFGLLFCTSFALMILSISCESRWMLFILEQLWNGTALMNFCPCLIQSDPSRCLNPFQSYEAPYYGVSGVGQQKLDFTFNPIWIIHSKSLLMVHLFSIENYLNSYIFLRFMIHTNTQFNLFDSSSTVPNVWYIFQEIYWIERRWNRTSNISLTWPSIWQIWFYRPLEWCSEFVECDK